MAREILPPWSEYRKALGVEEKEEFETFAWLNDLSLAKDKGDWTDCTDWDSWVLATKDKERRKISRYDERQIQYSDSEKFLASAKKGGASHSALCDTFRAKFNCRYDNERLLEIMKALRVEENHDFVVKSKEKANKRLVEDIEILTFLYRCPIRWFLQPYEVVVSSAHIEKMCAIYPDYEAHFETVMIALAEWDKKPSPESKPSAIFFEVFDAPDITPEQIEAMTKFNPEYADDIEAIKRTRDAQMKEYLLGKMFVIKPVSAAIAAQDKADKAWRIFNEAKREAEKAQREADIAMLEAETAKRNAMPMNA
jgi:hypothetical protein